MIFMMESQFAYVLDAIRTLRDRRLKYGKNRTKWPGFSFEYRLRTRRFDAKRYQATGVARGV